MQHLFSLFKFRQRRKATRSEITTDIYSQYDQVSEKKGSVKGINFDHRIVFFSSLLHTCFSSEKGAFFLQKVKIRKQKMKPCLGVRKSQAFHSSLNNLHEKDCPSRMTLPHGHHPAPQEDWTGQPCDI